MDIKDSVELVEKIATIAALVIGGIWAYFNYIKGRIYRPRLRTEINGKVVIDNGQIYLHITSTITNLGNSVVELQQKGSGIRILGHDRSKVSSVQSATWKRLATYPVFDKHGWLEAKETIEDERLVISPLSDNCALRLELRAISNKIAWTHSKIIILTPKEETQDGIC